MTKIKCPVCDGKGNVQLPNTINVDTLSIKRYMVKHLHEKGYSMRQIMRALNYKSTRSVSLIIHDN
jgi:hypothetical protein